MKNTSIAHNVPVDSEQQEEFFMLIKTFLSENDIQKLLDTYSISIHDIRKLVEEFKSSLKEQNYEWTDNFFMQIINFLYFKIEWRCMFSNYRLVYSKKVNKYFIFPITEERISEGLSGYDIILI